jgi:hypothetical protein
MNWELFANPLEVILFFSVLKAVKISNLSTFEKILAISAAYNLEDFSLTKR